MTTPSPEIRDEPIDSPVAAPLVDAQWREIMERYGVADVDVAHDPLDPADFRAPLGAFVVAFVGDEAVGCGGIRPHDTDVPGIPPEPTGEVKRMYVVPSHRGRRVSVAVLRAVEDRARALGHHRLILETGVEQPEAIALYVREGYTRIANHGPRAAYDGLHCYVKQL